MVLVFILHIFAPNAKKASGNPNKSASFKKGIQYARQQNVESLYNGRNVVCTIAPSMLIWSPSFLHVMRTSIKVSLSSNFGPIPSLAAE